MKFYLKNFGCKTNWFDLVALKERFRAVLHDDFEESEFEESDVVVLNSCSVTRDAEKELFKWLRRAKRKGKKVIVTGCLANLPGAFEKLADEGADAVLGAGTYSLEAVKKALFGGNGKVAVKGFEKSFNLDDDLDWFLRSETFARHRVYLKVQEGCSKFCSFCSIPLTRGKPVSVPLEKVLEALDRVAQKGYAEAVLVGTHLALWGREFGMSFSDLALAVARKSRVKVRFSSLSPGELDEKFFEALKLGKDVFQPHFHLSVQSGSNRVLRSMRRWHTFEDFVRDAEKLLEIFPDACISTDIIVGFPTETEEDFETTVKNILDSPVGHIHVFPFSPRPKTVGAMLKPLPPDVLKHRQKRMLEVAEKKKREFVSRFVGREISVIVERVRGDEFEGTSSNYISVRGKGKVKEGREVKVRVEKVEGDVALVCAESG